MVRIKSLELNQIIKLLKEGKVGVIPTDTIYGIVGSAQNPETVEKIYKLRKRALDKPMIILIASLNDLNYFNITLTEKQKKVLEKIWPNPVSVILPCISNKFEYLHRGKKSLAFRMPKNEILLDILKNAGSLVAPSANFEGEKPSENIEEAKKYFGNKVSFYINGGVLSSLPSTIVEVNEEGEFKVLRAGAFRI